MSIHGCWIIVTVPYVISTFSLLIVSQFPAGTGVAQLHRRILGYPIRILWRPQQEGQPTSSVQGNAISNRKPLFKCNSNLFQLFQQPSETMASAFSLYITNTILRRIEPIAFDENRMFTIVYFCNLSRSMTINTSHSLPSNRDLLSGNDSIRNIEVCTVVHLASASQRWTTRSHYSIDFWQTVYRPESASETCVGHQSEEMHVSDRWVYSWSNILKLCWATWSNEVSSTIGSFKSIDSIAIRPSSSRFSTSIWVQAFYFGKQTWRASLQLCTPLDRRRSSRRSSTMNFDSGRSTRRWSRHSSKRIWSVGLSRPFPLHSIRFPSDTPRWLSSLAGSAMASSTLENTHLSAKCSFSLRWIGHWYLDVHHDHLVHIVYERVSDDEWLLLVVAFWNVLLLELCQLSPKRENCKIYSTSSRSIFLCSHVGRLSLKSSVWWHFHWNWSWESSLRRVFFSFNRIYSVCSISWGRCFISLLHQSPFL